MPGNLLEVVNLHVSYLNSAGRIPAVKNLSFSLDKGQVLGIAGESGSGKTTLAMAIMRLISSQMADIQGNVYFKQDEQTVIDLLNIRESVMESIRGKTISVIFQEPRSAFNPLFTCGNQIAETIRKHRAISKKDSSDRAKQWLERTDLSEPERIFGSYPHQLSGGQLQRAMIAMALCCQPSLLIADEPLASSDYSNHQSLLRLFKSFQKESGMSIIFISHDLSAIEQIADRVLIMNQGEIVEQGPADKVIYAPEHSYTKLLVSNRMNSGIRKNIKTNSVFTGTDTKFFSGMPVLSVQHLKKIFKEKNQLTGADKKHTNALKDLSFQLTEGETLGITGDSGSGKTTLARCLCGLLEADEGEIIFKQKKIFPDAGKKYSTGVNRKIQIIFQDPDTSLNPKMTVGETLMEPLLYHRKEGGRNVHKEFVSALMEKTGLEPALFDRYPHQLSGGQKQRAVIVRALVMQPEILICDEAVSALDVTIQMQILKLLNELKSTLGFSMIFISHDWPVVRFMSDRIMILEKGAVKFLGNPEEAGRMMNSEPAVH